MSRTYSSLITQAATRVTKQEVEGEVQNKVFPLPGLQMWLQVPISLQLQQLKLYHGLMQPQATAPLCIYKENK
jgi:hypothetical protein